MKYVIAVLCSAILYASDIDSVDSIVKDIENLRVEHSECKKNLDKFEKQVENIKNTLLAKENIIKNLSFKVKKLEETHTSINFRKNKLEKIQKVSPATFRLKTKAHIYDSVNGVKIATWYYKKSFTSDTQTANWVKITGSFVKEEWKESDKELWIKKENITKRLSR